MDNALEGFADTLKSESQLGGVNPQSEAAKGEVDRPFPQEQEYMEKSTRLKELNTILNMVKKDTVILDGNLSRCDMEPLPEDRGVER